jgi:hypothetical protein
MVLTLLGFWWNSANILHNMCTFARAICFFHLTYAVIQEDPQIRELTVCATLFSKGGWSCTKVGAP